MTEYNGRIDKKTHDFLIPTHKHFEHYIYCMVFTNGFSPFNQYDCCRFIPKKDIVGKVIINSDDLDYFKGVSCYKDLEKAIAR